MNKRIQVIGPAQSHIENKGSQQPNVDAALVASALGGEAMTAQVGGNPGPVTLYALRAELLRRRKTEGGDPPIAAAIQGIKIPLSDHDRTQLEELAGELASTGLASSPGQIASVLLHAAIKSIRQLDSANQDEEKLVAAITKQLVAKGEKRR